MKHTPETLAAFVATLPNPNNEERDLRRFFAYRTAVEIAESYNAQDLVEVLMDGVALISVTEELELVYSTEPDNEDMATSDLEEALSDFYLEVR